MKTIAFTFGMLLLSSLAQGKDLVVNIGGKDVTIPYRVMNREINEQDRGKGSRNSAVECSLLYYSLLAQGDITGASQLTTDHAAAVQQWIAYRERLGADDFKKEMAAYFTSKNVVLAELTFAGEVMLVVKTPDYTAGQLYQIKDGKYVVISGRPSSDASKTLGKALTLIQDGNVKL